MTLSNPTAPLPSSLTVNCSASCECRCTPKDGVSDCAPAAIGAVLQGQSQIEAELDRCIAELDRASVRAMLSGDLDGARELADRFYAAIRSRTKEHQARLLRENDERIDGMTFAGRWTDCTL